MMDLYRRLDIWVRIDQDNVACYRCLELIAEGKFCVLTKDFMRAEPRSAESFMELEKQFIRLLGEIPPENRNGLHATLSDAIASYDGKTM